MLKSGGRLILRDNTGPVWLMGFMNRVVIPLVNLIGHGDVKGIKIRTQMRQVLSDYNSPLSPTPIF